MPPPAKVFLPARELMLMMSPEPRRIMEGATARETGKNTFKIGVQDAVPIGFGFLMDRSDETDAGVVHEDGDGAEGCFCLGDHVEDSDGICNIGDLVVHGHAERCEFTRGVLESGAIPAADGHGSAQQSQLVRDGAANTTACTGN